MLWLYRKLFSKIEAFILNFFIRFEINRQIFILISSIYAYLQSNECLERIRKKQKVI